MNHMRRVIHEMHRRSLWQVLGIYLVGSWIGYQVVLGLTDGIGLPGWVPGFAVVLFIIGLPIVLATAFVQEGLPGTPPARPGHDLATPAADSPPDTASTAPATPAPSPPTHAQSWLTWRRAIFAGAAAFMLLGLIAGSYMVARAAGIGPFGSLIAAGKLDDQARILIADFRSAVGDTTLASVVTEAFRIDLARSTTARLVEPRDVREVLRRMGRTDAPRLDEELAREIALRDGIDAYVTGEVSPAGSGHVLTARLIATADGEVLVALRETARNEAELFTAIDRLSRSLRERTGESLRTIRRTEPLARVTTSSLAALDKYTQAGRASAYLGDPGRARQLYEEAVALDSTFAAAWHALAVSYSNAYRPEQALDAVERALRHADRLNEEQRLGSRAMYHGVRREYALSASAYEAALAINPASFGATNNLALAYLRMGDHQRAAHYFRRAAELDTLRFFAYANLAEALVMLGQPEAARDTFAHAARLAPASGWAVVGAAMARYSAGEYDESETNLRAILRDESTATAVRRRATDYLARLVAARGRLREAEQVREALWRGSPAEAERERLANSMWNDILLLQQPDRARGTLARWRLLVETDTASGSDRFLQIAEACAWLEDIQCARENVERGGAGGTLKPWAPLPAWLTRGALALAERDVDGAVRSFRAAADPNCPACEDVLVGRAFDQAGRQDSALAAYERFVATPSMDRIYADAFLGPALGRLGELYEQRGDTGRAADMYSRLIRLWERADPELQPRVREARRRLALLQPDR